MTDKEKFNEFILIRIEHKAATEVQSLRDYIDETAVVITSEQNKIVKAMNKELKKYEHDYRSQQAIESYYVDDIFKYSDFSNILFSSSFIASCSLFESLLREICIITYPRAHNLTVDDISGKTNVDRYKKFLTKVIELEMTKFDATLNKMKEYHELRNKIVHEYSNYWTNRDKPITQSHLHKFVFNNPYLDCPTNDGRFKIKDKRFILDYCDLAEHYLTEVLELLKGKANSWKHTA